MKSYSKLLGLKVRSNESGNDRSPCSSMLASHVTVVRVTYL